MRNFNRGRARSAEEPMYHKRALPKPEAMMPMPNPGEKKVRDPETRRMHVTPVNKAPKPRRHQKI